MASPAFRHAFDLFPDTTNIPAILKRIVVKIIEPDVDKHSEWENTDFMKGLKAEGINISFLSCPCVLTCFARNETGRHHIMQSEIKHVFTPQFWPRVLEEPVVGAIIISHLRSMNEGLHELNGKPGIIVILEGDVKPTKNSLPLFAYFIANILGNPHLADTAYTALTFSEWHPTYAGKVHRVAHDFIPKTKHPPYFSMCSLPVETAGGDQYQFVGQGGRALAFNSTWVQELVQKKVGHYYDVWLINELSLKRREWKSQNYSPTTLATVCIPSIFEHTPDMDKRFRGSGRLSAIASNAAEENAYYICLDMSGNWGLCNRLQTVVLMLQFCSWHRLGLYILWIKNEACPGLFEELFEFDFQCSALKSVPFIKVFDNPANSSWKASMANKTWCLGYMYAQSNVQDGLKVIHDQYMLMKNKKKQVGKK